MKKKVKYRSKVAEAVHEGVRGMHRLGLVDKTTMREFDVRTLTKIEDLSAKQIQACVNAPAGPTLKLLWLIRIKGLDAVM
jgi:hypothetical protein